MTKKLYPAIRSEEAESERMAGTTRAECGFCGALVVSPCATSEKSEGCELPSFAWPNRAQAVNVYDDALLFACDEAACHNDPMFYEIFAMDDRWDIIRAILKAADAHRSPQESVAEDLK